jgi:hypothetical protein
MPDKYGATEVNITFRTNNAAFQEGNGTAEVARILRQLAQEVEDSAGSIDGRIRDINGNRIGEYDVEVPDGEEDDDQEDEDDDQEDEDDEDERVGSADGSGEER